MRIRHKWAWRRIAAVLPSNAILRAAILLVAGGSQHAASGYAIACISTATRPYLRNVPLQGPLFSVV
jgi:hypothetical protein